MLTAKKQRFCDEYLIDFNGAAAARRSGYSVKTAHEQAARLLANVNIQDYLKEKKKILSDKSEITLQMVLDGYKKLAFYDSRKFYDANGNLIDIQNLQDDEAFALTGFEVTEEKTMNVVTGYTKKIKMSDRRAALDSICKVLGYNSPDKVENNIHLSDKPIVFK